MQGGTSPTTQPAGQAGQDRITPATGATDIEEGIPHTSRPVARPAGRHLKPSAEVVTLPVAGPALPAFPDETLYVGIDVGKAHHVAGFVCKTLLQRHGQFEGCPALAFEQSREEYRRLITRIESYAPLAQCAVILEHTGHYHLPLVQFLQELDVTVYIMHVQRRAPGLLKTDKRDALSLANHLYNQLELGAQAGDRRYLARRVLPSSETAQYLQHLTQHRYEIAHVATQQKNKLIAISDQLFPELTQVYRDPIAPAALALRAASPTPQAVAAASLTDLMATRRGHFPSAAKLAHLRELAASSIGTRPGAQQRGLVFEQTLLIAELQLYAAHIAALDREIAAELAQCREGLILTSIPGIGNVAGATILATIGTIGNFRSAAALKSYFGWAPRLVQSGVTLNRSSLARGGVAKARQAIYMATTTAIREDTEWKDLYDRLIPRKCAYDERRKRYKGKIRVIGRIAGQMLTLIFALLKADAEATASVPPGAELPPPVLYDREVHRAHRQRHYRPSKPLQGPRGTLTLLPSVSPTARPPSAF